MRSRKRSLVTLDNSSTTSRAVSVRRDAYQSPYKRVVHLIERMLRLPSIATYLYPILINEHAEATESWKDPTRPLKTFFAHGYTLNILLNELESPFVATINLFERVDEGDYEAFQTELFWQGCVAAGFAAPGVLGKRLWFADDSIIDERGDGEYLDLTMTTVAAILDTLEEHGRLGRLDPRYTRPCVIYPSVQHASEGAPRHAVLAAELSRTEVAYMQDLERLTTFAASVRAHVACDKIDASAIFGHIDGILALHHKLSMRIQYVAAMPVEAQFFDTIFVGLMGEFDVYSQFCAAREQSERAYRSALPFLKQMDCAGIDPEFDVPSLFMRPVQRLAQYPILFQSIVDALCESCKHTGTVDHRVRAVKSAYAAVRHSKRILRRANEATREALNQVQCGEFFERLDIPLSSQTQLGRLLTTTSRVSTAIGGGIGFDEREAFLFENSLVVCKVLSHGRPSRIKRTLSSLQVSIRSPSLRFKPDGSPKRQSESSASSVTLHGSPVFARTPSPDLSGGTEKQSPGKNSLADPAGFQLLPAIDMGHSPSLISPPPPSSINPALLGSHASLLSLREKHMPTIRFTSTTDVNSSHSTQDTDFMIPSIKTSLSESLAAPLSRLSVCEQISVRAITMVSVVGEPGGFMRLCIQASDDGGVDSMVVFRQMSSETTALWVRMLKQAVRLVPVDDANVCATPGNPSPSAVGCLLVNPDVARSAYGRKIAVPGYV
ncbi:Guanine nucleotide exchange factor for Cdc42p [Coemansia sp. RSA 1813]|nr:Guanine nucleotide exchange factor for Cdc42p [Coemansia sp. RSA 1843]KAJ2092167.1 Guanine nucleotide exchange factor for Cdc42p [Coemansia sp. RSA 986]KAJ2215303.1 Guanine nucleotide exchange factor for Cdc42p [Coemansia sp. RSA 487]KAJ2570360.1 Guanine nucleotide exchange factor for Cdc42p [Coemansia sp. RSA 1813]